MIDIVSGSDLAELAAARNGHCVSLYIPTHRAGPDTGQDQIRLKNALSRARKELRALGAADSEADELLAPVADLTRDNGFWTHLEGSLAVFAGGGRTSAYRLSSEVEELVVVSDRFHIKPLVPLVATGEVFHVLALSQNKVRLLRGSRYEISEIALGDIPPSLADALWYEDRESQLHSHGAKRVGMGRVTATFHGHGVGIDTKEVDLQQFLSAVDEGLAHMLGPGSGPLVLAGVGSTVSQFRRLSRYPVIAEGAVEGSVEDWSCAQLHERSWPLVQPLFTRARARAEERVLAERTPTTDELAEALDAARSGRVESVFVPLGTHRWGSFDLDSVRVEEHDERQPGDSDLLDDLAAATLGHGGEVYAVDAADVPGGTLVAASLRY